MWSKIKEYLLNLLGLGFVTLIFTLICMKYYINIIDVIKITWELLFIGDDSYKPLYVHLFHTLYRFIVGYIIAIFTAIPVGLLVGRVKSIANFLTPPIELFRFLPSAVMIPIGIMLFGIENVMKIFIIWFGSFWPMLIVTIQSSRHIDSDLIDTCSIFQKTKITRLFTVILPASIPQILGGARASLAIALLLTVTVEMIVAGDSPGLGSFIMITSRSFQEAQMIAGIIILSISGYLINFLFLRLEKLVKEKRFAYYEKSY